MKHAIELLSKESAAQQKLQRLHAASDTPLAREYELEAFERKREMDKAISILKQYQLTADKYE
jgi:hypothetical protein